MKANVRTHSLAYAALAVLFLISFTHWLRNSIDRLDETWRLEEYVRPPFDLGDFADAYRLQPEAEAAGVRDGDIVASVEGRSLQGLSDYDAAVRRASAPVKNVSVVLQPDQGLGTSRLLTFVFTGLFLVVMPLFCIALGFWVAAVRPGDRAAWLLLTLMLSISTIIGASGRTMFGRTDPVQPLLTAYAVFFSNLASTALVLFAIAFPDAFRSIAGIRG